MISSSRPVVAGGGGTGFPDTMVWFREPAWLAAISAFAMSCASWRLYWLSNVPEIFVPSLPGTVTEAMLSPALYSGNYLVTAPNRIAIIGDWIVFATVLCRMRFAYS